MSKIPAAIGPYSTNQVKDGLIITSGQLPIDPEDNKINAKNITDQTNQSLKNLLNVLESEDFSAQDIMFTFVFLDDMNDFAEFNEEYSKFFGEPYPARTCIEASRLPQDALVEIMAVAKK